MRFPLGLVGRLDFVYVPVDLNTWTLLHLAVEDDNGGTGAVHPPCGVRRPLIPKRPPAQS